jgi:4-carboxymuconolactone decarboxylase
MAIDRFPPIVPESWSDEQRAAAQEIIDGPRKALLSPFIPMLRSPELLTHAQRMGEYLRYRSAVGLRISEWVILIVAQHWGQPVEWAIHCPIALHEGVSEKAVKALASGRYPEEMSDDEKVAYHFSTELLKERCVSDVTWAEAINCFGEQGVMDLIGINGYYAMLAMTMNACRTAVPNEVSLPLERTIY